MKNGVAAHNATGFSGADDGAEYDRVRQMQLGNDGHRLPQNLLRSRSRRLQCRSRRKGRHRRGSAAHVTQHCVGRCGAWAQRCVDAELANEREQAEPMNHSNCERGSTGRGKGTSEHVGCVVTCGRDHEVLVGDRLLAQHVGASMSPCTTVTRGNFSLSTRARSMSCSTRTTSAPSASSRSATRVPTAPAAEHHHALGVLV